MIETLSDGISAECNTHTLLDILGSNLVSVMGKIPSSNPAYINLKETLTFASLMHDTNVPYADVFVDFLGNFVPLSLNKKTDLASNLFETIKSLFSEKNSAMWQNTAAALMKIV